MKIKIDDSLLKDIEFLLRDQLVQISTKQEKARKEDCQFEGEVQSKIYSIIFGIKFGVESLFNKHKLNKYCGLLAFKDEQDTERIIKESLEK